MRSRGEGGEGMHTSDPQSVLWSHTAIAPPSAPRLQGDARADILVIGGGFTGLSAALHAAEAGADVVLLEAQDAGFGASGRNNGQVIPTYARHNPDDLVRLYGDERGERMNGWVARSADLVFDLIRRHGIDCDAVQQGWLQPAHAPSRMKAVRAKYDQWARRGAPVELLDGERTAAMTGSDYYRHGGWMHRSGGHIQPLAYARGLAHAAIRAGVRMHARSPAVALERKGVEWRVRTPAGTVTAAKAILATNAYTGDLWPSLRQSIVPVRTFHVATRPLGNNVSRSILPGEQGLSDTRQALWAFRLDRFGRLITTAAPLFTAGARPVLGRSTVARIARVFPQVEDASPEYVWEGNIAMTVDRLPRYHELSDGLYAGLGYSGRGIAIGTAMGKLMADRATGMAADALPIPASPVRPLPAHGIVVPLSRAMLLLYRWRDSRP